VLVGARNCRNGLRRRSKDKFGIRPVGSLRLHGVLALPFTVNTRDFRAKDSARSVENAERSGMLCRESAFVSSIPTLWSLFRSAAPA
jgi:hypothetical protein